MTDKAPAPKDDAMPIERCPCGYPMPCSKNVPVDFCRARLQETSHG